MSPKISPLAYVDPAAKIADDVEIAPFAYVEGDVEIGKGCVLKPYASVLDGTRMGERNVVHQHALVGVRSQSFRKQGAHPRLEIGNDNTIREYAVLVKSLSDDTATTIGDHNFFMSTSHVGHNTVIEDHVVVGINGVVSGRCRVDSHAVLSTSSILFQGVHAGAYTVVSGGARVRRDIPPFITTTANPTSFYSVNHPLLERHGFSEKGLRHIAHAYEIVYRTKMDLADYISRIEAEVPMDDYVRQILDFLRDTEARGGAII